jgi:hypothetical protein
VVASMVVVSWRVCGGGRGRWQVDRGEICVRWRE